MGVCKCVEDVQVEAWYIVCVCVCVLMCVCVCANVCVSINNVSRMLDMYN